MSIKRYYNLGRYTLYPINRSLTGNGVKKTLKIIKNEFPELKIKKIKSGTRVFDWKVPSEWNVSEAYVVDKFGNKIIDFKKNNLHLVGYSEPVNKKIYKKELFEHIYYLKNQREAIPYITSYYKRRWGFCISYNQKKIFDKKYKKNDKFKVLIKSSLNKNGYLNYGELILKSKNKQEILISTYICHPSMANNELSGSIVSMSLINYFRKLKNLKKTIRFIFIPETIGSIVYLNKNLQNLKKNLIGGYNLSSIGDERLHSCMFTKYGNSASDKILIESYKSLKIKYKVFSFLKRGSDERQYNSPGIDLPISSIFRTKYGEYPEYHTSLDNFDLVTLKGIKGGFSVAKKALQLLNERIFPRTKILCEPYMSKRGLYPTISKDARNKSTKLFMDFLQYSDGKNSLEEISSIIKTNLKTTKKIYEKLCLHKLVD